MYRLIEAALPREHRNGFKVRSNEKTSMELRKGGLKRRGRMNSNFIMIGNSFIKLRQVGVWGWGGMCPYLSLYSSQLQIWLCLMYTQTCVGPNLIKWCDSKGSESPKLHCNLYSELRPFSLSLASWDTQIRGTQPNPRSYSSSWVSVDSDEKGCQKFVCLAFHFQNWKQ